MQDATPTYRLQILNSYRLILAIFLLVLYGFGWGSIYLGQHFSGIFLATTVLYGAFALFAMRWGKSKQIILCHLIADMIALTIWMWTSHGISSGLGILIIIPIVSSSLVFPTQVPLIFASVGWFSVLGIQQIWKASIDAEAYFQTGILGAIYFSAAFFGIFLSKRIKTTELIASQHAMDLAQLVKLNEIIIQQWHVGVIGVDAAGRVLLFNEAAKRFLEYQQGRALDSLSDISGELNHWWRNWQSGIEHNTFFQLRQSVSDINVQFIRLAGETQREESISTLILLDDASRTAKQAQQMKLISLGRFTASMAHELRNPLGAVGHAVQLLRESPHLGENDVRLCEIVLQNAERMNGVIKNILQLSRREQANVTRISLKKWLEKFVPDLQSQSPEKMAIELRIHTGDIQVAVDPSQLQQVLVNLCENGLRYSERATGRRTLRIETGFLQSSRHPYIDVIDDGTGIDPQIEQFLFEPFYTSERHGTGLGLYIAKELCEANQARLDFIRRENQGACFRIHFQTVI